MTYPMGWQQMMTELALASNPTEARKFSRDDEVRPGTPEPEVIRLKAPALSRSWGLISIVVVHRNADGARDYHRAIDSKWRYDEGDGCSEERGYRPVQRTRADACTTEQERARPAPRRIRPSAGSPRGTRMVRANCRGATSETLLTLQEIVS